jgi:LysM repeat protein
VRPDRDRHDEDDVRAKLSEWGPRILAPLAFFVAATILILLVNNAIESGSDAAATTTPTSTSPASVSTEPTGTGDVTTAGPRQFHRIKVGDTLETIAAQYETTVDDLIALNPNVDPNNLQPGRRIRVQ